ncbi:putative ubiquitin fusion degradation protein [Trypanosoma vivax]|nr:putative ubiquitin fusion degradation protein [Trypanosoma vivax]
MLKLSRIDGNAIESYQKHLSVFTSLYVDNVSPIESSARVLLPFDCLAELSSKSVPYPLQFRIRSGFKTCYAGVLDFTAPTGIIIVPQWMMPALGVEVGDTVLIETCVLSPGKLIKLRPQESSFIELSDPRQVLEMRLNEYPVLTKGTSIVLQYAGHDFIIDVIDILDEAGNTVDAISTVRADAEATELKVEFERPLDMPPSPKEMPITKLENYETKPVVDLSGVDFKPPTITGKAQVESIATTTTHTPFSGLGRRINEQETATEDRKSEITANEVREQRLRKLGLLS